MSAGANPASTELALWNESGKVWIALDGMPSATEVWAVAAICGSVVLSGLQVDTTHHFQAKARNGEDVETDLSPILAAKTSAPDAVAQLDVANAWVIEIPVGVTASQMTLSATFVNDPLNNAGYTYTWLSPSNPDTSKELVLVAGGDLRRAGTPGDQRHPSRGPLRDHRHRPRQLVFNTLEIEVLKRGDVNQDGVINGADIGPFTVALTGVDTDSNRIAICDLSADETVDTNDIQDFVGLLNGV